MKNINLTLERNVFLIFRYINRVNCSEYRVFYPDFLKNFNPLRIYRDPFKFDDISTDGRMDQIQNFDHILPKILDKTFEFKGAPRNSMSYSPIWFKM